MNEERCQALYEDLLDTISWEDMEKLLLSKVKYESASTKRYDEIINEEKELLIKLKDIMKS
jgi:hypothetical protein